MSACKIPTNSVMECYEKPRGYVGAHDLIPHYINQGIGSEDVALREKLAEADEIRTYETAQL